MAMAKKREIFKVDDHISGIRTMAKKREIFKVDEDALKDMMASESISCGKSGTDVGENVLPVTEKEKNVPEVKTQGQEKSRKTIRADPGSRTGREGGNVQGTVSGQKEVRTQKADLYQL